MRRRCWGHRPWPGKAAAQDKKIKVYLALSYSGNAWQSEAANVVKALAKTPPYDKTVDLTEVISGTDPQAQIAAYESMIDAGAQGIISFPDFRDGAQPDGQAGVQQGRKVLHVRRHRHRALRL